MVDNGTAAAEQIEQNTKHIRTDELASFITASLDSMTPAIVQRLAATVSQMAELVDIINTDEMKNLLSTVSAMTDNLERSLVTMKELEESEAIAGLAKIGVFADALRSSLTASLVVRSLSSVLMLAEMGDKLLEAVHDAKHEVANDNRKLGPRSLLSALKDPQLQESLKFLLAISKRLPAVLEGL
ncbi:MAG: DUF1641 domain-containing protein [Firmicutes bacterium]|nr:DUF1641 domain-containing protein [Bacillota bacterium]